jgi:hypothetical protein
MIKRTKHNFFTCIWICSLAFAFTTFIQLFATPNNKPQNNQIKYYSISSSFSVQVSDHSIIQKNSYASFCIVEQELEENEDDTKKRNALLFALNVLFKSHFSCEKLKQTLVPFSDTGLSTSIPLYIFNCIFLI